MHKSQLLLIGAISCVGGLVLAQFVSWPIGILATAVITVIGALVSVARPVAAPIVVVVCGLLIGGMRTSLLENPQESIVDGFDTFVGVIVEEPEIRVDRQVFILEREDNEQQIRITRPLQPRLQIGEVLELTCEVRRPEAFDGFAYDKYLQRHGIAASCSFPRMKRLGREENWRTALFDFKESLMDGVRRTLPSPENTIILGALFGDKRAVPENVMEAFRTTGTSHVLVISGLHMTLIAGMLLRIFSRLPLSRRTVILMVVMTLLLYVLLTGLQTSAIRATVFASAAFLFELTGRPQQSLRVLILAATVMLLINPLLFIHDVGFQLSFAASGGIMLFSRWFEERLHWLPEILGLRSGMSASLAAILTTSPIIAYGFQTFSFSAFVANVVMVPLMPLIMNGAVLLTATAALLPPLAEVIAMPMYYLIHLLIDLAQFFAQVPYASVSLPAVPAWLLAFMMTHILGAAWYINRKNYE